MEVTVFGPNLSSAGQQLGDLHVHRADCGDCRHYGPGRKFGGERDDWTFDASSIAEIAEDCYADQIAEGSMSIGDAIACTYFAPCVELPTYRSETIERIADENAAAGVTQAQRDAAIATVADELSGAADPAAQLLADELRRYGFASAEAGREGSVTFSNVDAARLLAALPARNPTDQN